MSKSHTRRTEVSEYLTTEELSAMIRTPIATLHYWNTVGKGPRSYKVGTRRLYRLDHVEAWLEEQASDERRGGAPRAS